MFRVQGLGFRGLGVGTPGAMGFPTLRASLGSL